MQNYIRLQLSPMDVALIRRALQDWQGVFPSDSVLKSRLDVRLYKQSKNAGWVPTI